MTGSRVVDRHRARGARAVVEALRARGLCPSCRAKVGHRPDHRSGECAECAEQRAACAAGRHRFGTWGPCGCMGAIADHEDWFAAASGCGWEFRTCLFCVLAAEERYAADDLSTQPLPIQPGSGADS